MKKKEFDICVDSDNVDILDWISEQFNNGNWDKNFRATVLLQEIDYTEDGEIKVKDSLGEMSDGYHTFNELYYHRMILFSVICHTYINNSWKSWKHHDGTMYDDYFIVGITTPEGDYTYHYHKDYWDLFKVEELEFAPKWDGHKPEDITRLLSLIDKDWIK